MRFDGNGQAILIGNDPSNPAHFTDRIVRVGASVADTAGIVWPNDPVRNGHIFLGWYDTAATTGGNRFDEDSPINAAVVLFARWQLAPAHTVTFNLQGGTLAFNNIATRQARDGLSIRDSWAPPHNLNHGVTWPGSAPNVTRTNMTLEGWYTLPNGGGTRFAPSGNTHTA
ncbi:MAG: InlB B-repeat-containing protein, partial [Defluviitaleaceae bacterium]|nr:InlB B-repeat-containing protein [Defluviitaleaceae bacterium]